MGKSDSIEYVRLSQQVRGALQWYMSEHGVSRAEVARRMGVTPGRVSQLLSGDENLTLRTLSSLATCLDARFEVELVAADASRSRS